MAKLPKGWVEVELRDVTEPIQTVDPSVLNRPKFHYVDIGSINNSTFAIDSPKEISIHEAPSRARRMIQTDDVLFSTVRTYLKNIAMVGDEYDGEITSTGIAVVRANKALMSRYSFHLLRSEDFVRRISKRQDGTLYPAVTDKNLFATKISLPPVTEQRRIVARVDRLLARITRAREELARIPVLLERANSKILAKVYEEAADVQADNQTKALERLENVCKSITDGDHQAPPKAKHGIPFITISAMNDGAIDLSKATRFVPKRYYEDLDSKRRPTTGDVLYSVTGSFGIPALVKSDEEFVFQRHIAILRVNKDRLRSEFLYKLLSAPQVISQAEEVATGTAQLTVPLRGLRAFQFPVPPLKTQLLFEEYLQKAQGSISKILAEVNLSREKLDALEQQILAKAFRGELVPQDPNDQPASLLLEQLKAERESAKTSTPKNFSATKQRKPRTPRRSTMPKARTDDDVWHKPYLNGLLQVEVLIDDIDLSAELGFEKSEPRKTEDIAQALFKKSELEIADFYKQLAWEIEAGYIREEDGRLRTA